ncbi:unnamed protein product [Cylindrotheca closterium]|uniref:Uncharacterized protein n=1 Tax=Cylindrotheca closterium TaxID=2856 RepID=A0AAD2G6A9_9STRA|nr:unnamed protein product [Cylindrotheca closterium]
MSQSNPSAIFGRFLWCDLSLCKDFFDFELLQCIMSENIQKILAQQCYVDANEPPGTAAAAAAAPETIFLHSGRQRSRRPSKPTSKEIAKQYYSPCGQH